MEWGPLAIDGKGNVFGVVQNGGNAGTGYVYELHAKSAATEVLASFDGENGVPEGGVVMDKAGNLFGTFSDSGLGSGDGGVYEVAAGAHAVTLLAGLDGRTTGELPGQALLVGTDGKLYGAALQGGAGGAGTVFSVAMPAIVPVAAKLVIQEQPRVNSDGVTELVVAVLDARGKAISGGNFSVTLTLKSGPAGALIGPVTVDTVAGAATFDLTLPAVGGTYRFAATEGALKAAATRGVKAAKRRL
jgi:uncharacterized repeat protein (TIGR03803 family)